MSYSIMPTSVLSHFMSKIKASFWPKTDVAATGTLDIESTPTANSGNLVTSGGVWNAIVPVKTTWAALKSLRNGGNLQPGQIYQITDYSCATFQSNTSSAGHVFDILVIADTPNALNETARACLHSGDSYFSNSKLEAWELKYSLDNDDPRFSWGQDESYIINSNGTLKRYPLGDVSGAEYPIAWKEGYTTNYTATETPEIGDNSYYMSSGAGPISILEVHIASEVETGRGVIYWMRDEYGNECPYDFKNILFNNSSTGYNEYTFNDDDINPNTPADASLLAETHNNIVKPYYSDLNVQTLNGNIFHGGDENYDNFLNYGCHNNSFKRSHYISFDSGCYGNTVGYGSYNISFASGCYSNIVGMSNSDIILDSGCFGNEFGYGAGNQSNRIKLGFCCNNNTFGQASDITLGSYCSSNTFTAGMINRITVGNNCSLITVGMYAMDSSIGNYCTSITLGKYCEEIRIGDRCSSINLGQEVVGTEIGEKCQNITIGKESDKITIGPYCSNIKFGDSSAVKNYYSKIVVETGNQNIYLYCSGTTAYNNKYQNVLIGLGCNNTSTWKTITDSNVGQTYKTTYQPTGSQTITV